VRTNPAGVSTPTIEAGIVLADQDGYFCMPLEQVGMSEDAEIVALKSSCDCVQPRLVQYAADGDQIRQAILLEYVPDLPSTGTAGEARASDIQPVHLGAIIEVVLVDGTKQDFTVNLLHTVLYQEEF
jgi:hypothetical protein